MTTVKTAVSLDASLFARVEESAREMQVSRSRLVALAIEDFLRRRESKQLTEQMNAVYADHPQSEEEKALLRGMKRRHREIVQGEWE